MSDEQKQAQQEHSGAEECYFLVFGKKSVTLLPLPPAAELFIGIDESGDLQVSENSHEAMELKISNYGAEIAVEGIGAAAAVWINHEPLTRRRTVLSGDVIAFGEINLVLNRDPRRRTHPALLPADELQRRLQLGLIRSQSAMPRTHDRKSKG